MPAEFDTTVRTKLTFADGIFTVADNESGTFHAVDITGSDTSFDDGDTIRVNDLLNYQFFGHFEGGWIGKIGLEFYLFSSVIRGIGEWFMENHDPFPVCFLEGTRIATPDGDRAVETLAIGDLVTTAGGATRPVRWIGRQTIVAVFADPLHAHPIRIVRGALGDRLPIRDLFVSPDHALLVDGLLVQASALVNGETITRAPAPAPRFVYFHVELADHSLILAEGIPAETFVDHVTRRRFDNFAEFEALYGAEQGNIAEIALPRVKSVRQLPRATRDRLDAYAATQGVATAA
jgi:hypothetical protein